MNDRICLLLTLGAKFVYILLFLIGGFKKGKVVYMFCMNDGVNRFLLGAIKSVCIGGLKKHT
jgi:hypothetical protein